MKRILSIIIHLAILVFIAAGEWLNIEAAERLALFAVWVVSILTLLTCMAPSDDVFKNYDERGMHVIKVIFALEVVALVAAGSFITASVYVIAWFFMWGKRVTHYSKVKEA